MTDKKNTCGTCIHWWTISGPAGPNGLCHKEHGEHLRTENHENSCWDGRYCEDCHALLGYDKLHDCQHPKNMPPITRELPPNDLREKRAQCGYPVQQGQLPLQCPEDCATCKKWVFTKWPEGLVIYPHLNRDYNICTSKYEYNEKNCSTCRYDNRPHESPLNPCNKCSGWNLWEAPLLLPCPYSCQVGGNSQCPLFGLCSWNEECPHFQKFSVEPRTQFAARCGNCNHFKAGISQDPTDRRVYDGECPLYGGDNKQSQYHRCSGSHCEYFTPKGHWEKCARCGGNIQTHPHSYHITPLQYYATHDRGLHLCKECDQKHTVSKLSADAWYYQDGANGFQWHLNYLSHTLYWEYALNQFIEITHLPKEILQVVKDYLIQKKKEDEARWAKECAEQEDEEDEDD